MSCDAAMDHYDLPNEHCDSCHDDMDEGYEAGWIEIDGKEHEVCCQIMRAVELKVTLSPAPGEA